MAIAQAPLQSVQAQFSYANWNDLYLKEKPYKLFIDLPQKHAHAPRTNLSFQPHATPVYDVRGNEAEFVLDKNGFEILRHGTEITDFGNVAAIEQIYFTEMKELIMGKVDGAKRVEVFDWRVRQSMSEEGFLTRKLNLSDPLDKIMPTIYPHIDQTPSGAVGRVRQHFSAEADRLLQERVRIINVWRPLRTVENWPLAFCDTQTLQTRDLLAADYVRRHFVGETFFLLHSRDHRWYYLRDQQPDEVAMFKIYDSDASATHGCPHASFSLGDEDSLAPRESIEIRALVFGG
ncbi:hypothetical protein BDU57DRAFT_503956 [Ampelomyces quisqualis]|uniref:Methyltransferase n=1 Tax=Ampelomyces quisqualis TaxID=50730 RepID=A0A6A5QE91_AMPQU|nr:hypothetical protein BDU57DRAFT_503956 [Ampelomyces quisqualis]